MVKRALMCCLFAFSIPVGMGHAQDYGSVAAGQRLAQDICMDCHSIEPGNSLSPHFMAPSFQIVADTPGMNALALSVFFRTPHETMPNFIFKEDQQADLIAYILSLQSKTE